MQPVSGDTVPRKSSHVVRTRPRGCRGGRFTTGALWARAFVIKPREQGGPPLEHRVKSLDSCLHISISRAWWQEVSGSPRRQRASGHTDALQIVLRLGLSSRTCGVAGSELRLSVNEKQSRLHPGRSSQAVQVLGRQACLFLLRAPLLGDIMVALPDFCAII